MRAAFSSGSTALSGSPAVNHAVPSFVYAASSAVHDLLGERLLEHFGALLRQALVHEQIGEAAEVGVVASAARPSARAASSRARAS